jgi:hypothetical protein
MALRCLKSVRKMRGKRQWVSAFIIGRAQVELHRCWGAVFDLRTPLLDCPAAKKMVLPAHFVLLNKRKIFSIVALHTCQFIHKLLRIRQLLTDLEPSRNAPRNILEYLCSLRLANKKIHPTDGPTSATSLWAVQFRKTLACHHPHWACFAEVPPKGRGRERLKQMSSWHSAA